MKKRIIVLHEQGLSTRAIAEETGISRSYVWRVLECAGMNEHRELKEHRDSGQYTTSKRGVEGWPTIPFQIRITGRSHTQAIPRALGGEG